MIWGVSREAVVNEEEVVWGGEGCDEVLDWGGEGCRGVTDCGVVGLEGVREPVEPLETGAVEGASGASGGLGGWESERLAEGEVGKAGEENTNCLFCGVWCET